MRSSERGLRRVRLACLVACLSCAVQGTAAADPHALPSLAVPGGVPAAMRVLGDVRETGHAAFVHDVVCRFYNQPADANRTHDPSLRRLLDWFETQRQAGAPSPSPGVADAVPSPLSLAQWRDVLRLSSDPDVGHILASHDAALLYASLLRMPAATRARLAPQTDLLRALLPHATVLVIVAPVLERDADGWRLPGGDEARPIWTRLVGRPHDDPRFLEALLTREAGWLAVLADVLGGLAPAQQRAALGLAPAPADPSAPARLLRALRAASPEWSPRQRPFWRPTLDPALLLLQLPATDDGLSLPGTTDQWKALLDGRALPHSAAPSQPTSGPVPQPRRSASPPTPAWIVEQVFTGPAGRQRVAYEQVLFAVRRAGPPHGALDATTAGVAQALATHGQLVLTLERIGLDDLTVYARAVAIARRLEDEARVRARRAGALAGAARVDTRLVQLQAGLMLLTYAIANGTVDADGVRGHVEALLQAIEDDLSAARGVVWLESLAAASGEAPGDAAIDAPRGLDEALLRFAAGPAEPDVVHWEGTAYRIDPGAAAVARVSRLRTPGGAGLIDGAVDLVAHVRRTGADRARLRRWLDEHRMLVDGVGAEAGGWSDLSAAWHQAAAVPTPPALLTVASHLATLGLVELDYALAMGTGAELPLQPIEAARRHVFTSPGGSASRASGAGHAWSAPVVVVDEGTRWHVRGSVLGIDVALAPLALRRATTRLPSHRPTLNTADRRVLIESVPLVRRGGLRGSLASDVHEASNVARARLARAGSDAATCLEVAATLTAAHLRSALLAWQCSQQPSQVAGMLSMREMLALGGWTDLVRGTAPATLPATGRATGRAFGAVAQPMTGAWTLWMPPPHAADRFGGRWGTGIAASAFADLQLRALDLLGELGLPAVLLPEVLAGLTWEFVTRVPAAYPDDWFALNEMVWHIDVEAAERALALHTRDGVLRPTDW